MPFVDENNNNNSNSSSSSSSSMSSNGNSNSKSNIQITTPPTMTSPSPRKHRNSSFLHRLRLRKKDDSVKVHSNSHSSSSNSSSSSSKQQKSKQKVDGNRKQDHDRPRSFATKSKIQKLASLSPTKLKSKVSKRYKALDDININMNSGSNGNGNGGINATSDVSTRSGGRNRSRSRSHDNGSSKSNSSLREPQLTAATNTNTNINTNANANTNTSSATRNDINTRLSVKKRKSEEGASSSVEKNQTIAMTIELSDKNENNKGTSPISSYSFNGNYHGSGNGGNGHSPSSTGSVQKKYRESLSSIRASYGGIHDTDAPCTGTGTGISTDNGNSTSPSSSSPSSLSLPPMETLELNSSPVIDMDSSLSSSSPLSMETDALSSFYYADDELNDVHAHVRTRTRSQSRTRSRRRSCGVGSNASSEDLDFDEDFGTGQNHGRIVCNEGDLDVDMDGDADMDMDMEMDMEMDVDAYAFDSNSDDDDSSYASTVVNDLPPARLQKPPPGASKEEQDRFYWDLCYGNSNKSAIIEIPTKSWSASRKAPVKSCFSAKKTPWTEIAQSASKRIQMRKLRGTTTPTVFDQLYAGKSSKDAVMGMDMNMDPSPSVEKKGMVSFHSADNVTSTPKFSTPQSFETESAKKSVKFGYSSAAEFESTRPTIELTPLPAEQARAEFKVDEEETKSDEESAENHQETARNGDTLAMWEEDFDSICDDFDTKDSVISMSSDSDEELGALVQRRSSSRGGRASLHVTGNRRKSRDSRRSSTYFSKGGLSLLDPSDIDTKSSSTLPSPDTSNKNLAKDGKNNDNFGNRTSFTSRDSLQFSSPSTVGGSFLRLSSSGSETSKVTPTADVTCSSTLLRSVHSAGGAAMGRAAYHDRQDDTAQELKPSQLDFAKGVGSPTGVLNPNTKEISHSPDDFQSILQNPLNHYEAELLQALKSDVKNRHDLWTTSAIEDMDESNYHEKCSFLNVAHELGERVELSPSSASSVGRCDVADVVKMSVSLLEETNNTENNIDKKTLCSIVDTMQEQFEASEVGEIYTHFAEVSNMKWMEQEGDALATITNWLQPLYQCNCEEETRIANILGAVGEPLKKMNESAQKKHMKRRYKEETSAISDLEATLKVEMEKLESLKLQASYLTSQCELERSKTFQLQYMLLTSLLVYEHDLKDEEVTVTYSHLDGSETIVTWDSSISSVNGSRRESLSSMDSTASIAALSTPKAKRRANREKLYFNGEGRGHGRGFLPKGSVAHKLYCIFLDDGNMKRFMSEQLKSEHEMGILTLSDSFQRLDLLAADVMELQKYYTCKLEAPRSKTVILHVAISLGQLCSICIKFTFDLSKQRSILLPIPSAVFVEPITGEPAVPINTLAVIAQRFLAIETYTNAFLLKRTCTAIIDTILQGRNSTCV